MREWSHEHDNQDEQVFPRGPRVRSAAGPGHRADYPSLWAAVASIACVPQTLLEWVKRSEVDSGQRDGLASAERQRLQQRERENKALRRANEILKTASAFFAQAELGRKLTSSMTLSTSTGMPAGSSRRGPADLHGVAGCPVRLPATCCPPAQSRSAQ